MAPMKWRPKSLLAKKFKKKYKSNDSIPSVSSNNEQPEQVESVDRDKTLDKTSTLDRLLLRSKRKKKKNKGSLLQNPLLGQESTSSLVQEEEKSKEELEESVKFQTVPRNFHSVRQRRRSSSDKKSCISAQNSLYYLHQEISSELCVASSGDSFYHGILPRIDQKIIISSTTPIKNFRMETKTYFDQIQYPEIADSPINTTSYVIHNDVTDGDVIPNDIMFEEEANRRFLSLPANVPDRTNAPLVEMGVEDEPKPRKKKKKKKAKVQREFIEEEIIFVRLNVDGKEEIVRETVVRPISQLVDEKHIMQNAQPDYNSSTDPFNVNADSHKNRKCKHNLITSKCDTFPRSSKKRKVYDEICLNNFAAEVSKSVFISENGSKVKSEINLEGMETSDAKKVHENIILILMNDREKGTKFVLKPRNEVPMTQKMRQPLFVDTEQSVEDNEKAGVSSISSSETSGSGKKLRKKKERKRIVKEIEWIEEEIIIIRIDGQGNEHYVKETVRRPSRASLAESGRRSRKKPILPSNMPDPGSLDSQNVPNTPLEARNSGSQDWFEEKVLVARLDESGKKSWVPEVVRRPSLPAIFLLGQTNLFETSTTRPPFLKSFSIEGNPPTSVGLEDFHAIERTLPHEDVAECSEVESEVITECSEVESEYSESAHSYSTMNESQILDSNSDEPMSDEEIFPLTIFNNESSYRSLAEVDDKNKTPKRANNHQNMCNTIINDNKLNGRPISDDVFHSDADVISDQINLEVGTISPNFRRASQEHETDDFHSDIVSATPEPCFTVQTSPIKNQSPLKNDGSMQTELLNSVQNLNGTASALQNPFTVESLESVEFQMGKGFKVEKCSGAANSLLGFLEDSISEVDKRHWAEEINISNELFASKHPLGQYDVLPDSVLEINNAKTGNVDCTLDPEDSHLVCQKFPVSGTLNKLRHPEYGTSFDQIENEILFEPDYNISYSLLALDLQSPILAKLSILETLDTESSKMYCDCKLKRNGSGPRSFGQHLCSCSKLNICDEDLYMHCDDLGQRTEADKLFVQHGRPSCDQCVRFLVNQRPCCSYSECNQAVNAPFSTRCSFITRCDKSQNQKRTYSQSSYIPPLTYFADDMNVNHNPHSGFSETPSSNFSRHFSTSNSLVYVTNCRLECNKKKTAVLGHFSNTFPKRRSEIHPRVGGLSECREVNGNQRYSTSCEHSWLRCHGKKGSHSQQCNARTRHSIEAKHVGTSRYFESDYIGRNVFDRSHSLPCSPKAEFTESNCECTLHQKKLFSSPAEIKKLDHSRADGNFRWADDSQIQQKVQRVFITTSTSTSPFINRRQVNYRNPVTGLSSSLTSSGILEESSTDSIIHVDKFSSSERFVDYSHDEKADASMRSPPNKLLPKITTSAKCSLLSGDVQANPLSSNLGKISNSNRSTLTDPNRFQHDDSDRVLKDIGTIPQDMKSWSFSAETDLLESELFIADKGDAQSITSENLKSGDLLEESLVSESSKTSSLSKLNSTTEVIDEENKNSTISESFAVQFSRNGPAASKILMTSLNVTSPMLHNRSERLCNSNTALSQFCSDDSFTKVVASETEKTEAVKTVFATATKSTSAVVSLTTSSQKIEASKLPKNDFSYRVKTESISTGAQTASLEYNQGARDVSNVVAENDSESSSEESKNSVEVGSLESATQKIRLADLELTESSSALAIISPSLFESNKFGLNFMASSGEKGLDITDETSTRINGSYLTGTQLTTGFDVDSSQKRTLPISAENSIDSMKESVPQCNSEICLSHSPISMNLVPIQGEICADNGQLVGEDNMNTIGVEHLNVIASDKILDHVKQCCDNVSSEDPSSVDDMSETEDVAQRFSENNFENSNSFQISTKLVAITETKNDERPGLPSSFELPTPDCGEHVQKPIGNPDPLCLYTKLQHSTKSAALTETNNLPTTSWSGESTDILPPYLLQTATEEKVLENRSLAKIHTESAVTKDLCHLQISYSETPPSSVSEPESYKWAFPVNSKDGGFKGECNVIKSRLSSEDGVSRENDVFVTEKRPQRAFSGDDQNLSQSLIDEPEAKIIHAAGARSPISNLHAESRALEDNLVISHTESASNIFTGQESLNPKLFTLSTEPKVNETLHGMKGAKVSLPEDSENYNSLKTSVCDQKMSSCNRTSVLQATDEFAENNLEESASQLENSHNSMYSVQKSPYLLGEIPYKAATAVDQSAFDGLTQLESLPLEVIDIFETFHLVGAKEVEHFAKENDRIMEEYGDIMTTCSEPNFANGSDRKTTISENSSCQNIYPTFVKTDDLALETSSCFQILSAICPEETSFQSCKTNDVIVMADPSHLPSSNELISKPVEEENSVLLKINDQSFRIQKAFTNKAAYNFSTPETFKTNLEKGENEDKLSCFHVSDSSLVESQFHSDAELRKTKAENFSEIIVKEVESKLKVCGSKIGEPDVRLLIGSVTKWPNLAFEHLQVLEGLLTITLSQGSEPQKNSSILQYKQEGNFVFSDSQNGLYATKKVPQKCSLEITSMPPYPDNSILSTQNFPFFIGNAPYKALTVPSHIFSGACMQLIPFPVEQVDISETLNLLVSKLVGQISSQNDQSIENYGHIVEGCSEPRFGYNSHFIAVIGKGSLKQLVYPLFEKVVCLEVETTRVNNENLNSYSSPESSLKCCEENDVITSLNPQDFCQSPEDVCRPVKNESSILLQMNEEQIRTHKASSKTSDHKFSSPETIKISLDNVENDRKCSNYHITNASLVQPQLFSDAELRKTKPKPEDSSAIIVKEVDSKLKLSGWKIGRPDACYLIGWAVIKKPDHRFELSEDLERTSVFSLAIETTEFKLVKSDSISSVTVDNAVQCYNNYNHYNGFESSHINSVQNKPRVIHGKKWRGQLSIGEPTAGQTNSGKFQQCEEFLVYYQDASSLQFRTTELAVAHATRHNEDRGMPESSAGERLSDQNTFKIDSSKNANHETHGRIMNGRPLQPNEQNSNDDKNLIKNNPCGNFIAQRGEFDLSANIASANENERSQSVYIYPSTEVLEAFSVESETISNSFDTNVTRSLPDEPPPEAKALRKRDESYEKATKKGVSTTTPQMASTLAVNTSMLESLAMKIPPDPGILEVRNQRTSNTDIKKIAKSANIKVTLSTENSPTRLSSQNETMQLPGGVRRSADSFVSSKSTVPKSHDRNVSNPESSEVSSHLSQNGFHNGNRLQKDDTGSISSRRNDQTKARMTQNRVHVQSIVESKNLETPVTNSKIEACSSLQIVDTETGRSGNENQDSKVGQKSAQVSSQSTGCDAKSPDNCKIGNKQNARGVESENIKTNNSEIFSEKVVKAVDSVDATKRGQPLSNPAKKGNDDNKIQTCDSVILKSEFPESDNLESDTNCFVGSPKGGIKSFESEDVRKERHPPQHAVNPKSDDCKHSANGGTAVVKTENPIFESSDSAQNPISSSKMSLLTSSETSKTDGSVDNLQPTHGQSDGPERKYQRGNQPVTTKLPAVPTDGTLETDSDENKPKESDVPKSVALAPKKRLSSSPLRSRSGQQSSVGSLERPRAKRKYKERRRNLTPMSRIEELSERQSGSNDETCSKLAGRKANILVLPVMPRKMVIAYLPGLQSCKFDKTVKLDSDSNEVSLSSLTAEVQVASEASPALKRNIEDSINKYTRFDESDDNDIFPKLGILRKDGQLPSLKPEQVVLPVIIDNGAFPLKGIDKETGNVSVEIPEVVKIGSSDDKMEEKIACSKSSCGISLNEEKRTLPSSGIRVPCTSQNEDISGEGKNQEQMLSFVESNDSLNVSDYKIHLSAYASVDSYGENFDPTESQMLDDVLEDLNFNWPNLQSFNSVDNLYNNFQSLASPEGTKNDDLFQVSDDELQYPTQSSPILDSDRPEPSFSSIEPLSQDLLASGVSFDWSSVRKFEKQIQEPAEVSGNIRVKETFVRNFVISLPQKPKIPKKVLKRTAGQSLMSEAGPLKTACFERTECKAGVLLAAKDMSITVQRAPKRLRRDLNCNESNQSEMECFDSLSRRSRTISSTIPETSNASSQRPKTSDFDFTIPIPKRSRYDVRRSRRSRGNQFKSEYPGFVSLIPVSVTSDETKTGQPSPKQESSSSNNQNFLSSTFNSKSRESGYRSEQQERAKRFQEAGKLFFGAPRFRKIEEQEGSGIFIDDEMYSKPPNASSALWKYNAQKRYNIQRGDWTRDSNLFPVNDDVIESEPSMRRKMCKKGKKVGRCLLKYFLIFLLLYLFKYLITNDYFFDYTCRSREFITTKSTGMGPF